MKILLAIVGLVIVVVAAYLVYFKLVVNPRVVDELRTSPDGERARQVMLLTLPEGRTIPVNYLREGSKVFVGADGPWWRQFAGDGVTTELFIQGRSYAAQGRAVLDDNAYRDEVFSRLRPTVPGWVPEFIKGTLLVFTLPAGAD